MATRRNSSLSLPQNNILSSDGWNLCPRCCICWCALPNYNSHFYNAIPRVVQTRRKKKGRWKDMNPSAGFVWRRERKLLKRRTQLVHRWLCETLFDPRSTCFRLAWQNNKLLSVFLPHSNTDTYCCSTCDFRALSTTTCDTADAPKIPPKPVDRQVAARNRYVVTERASSPIVYSPHHHQSSHSG